MSSYIIFTGSIFDFSPLSDVLQKRPKSPTLKNHIINYLKDTTKSFDYTLMVLKKLEHQARDELVRLGGNTILSAILDKLHVDALGP